MEKKGFVKMSLLSSSGMFLTENQVCCLGANDDAMKNRGLLRTKIQHPKKMGTSFFDCCNIVYEFKLGQRRYVGFGDTELDVEPKLLNVTKTSEGNGFFPTIASRSVLLQFRGSLSKYERKELENLQRQVPEMKLTLLASTSYLCTFPDIYEFDFLPHNFGFCLAKLSTQSKFRIQ